MTAMITSSEEEEGKEKHTSITPLPLFNEDGNLMFIHLLRLEVLYPPCLISPRNGNRRKKERTLLCNHGPTLNPFKYADTHIPANGQRLIGPIATTHAYISDNGQEQDGRRRTADKRPPQKAPAHLHNETFLLRYRRRIPFFHIRTPKIRFLSHNRLSFTLPLQCFILLFHALLVIRQ